MFHILNRVVLILQKLSPYLVLKMFTKLCQYPCFYFYIGLNYSISTNLFLRVHIITIAVIIGFTYMLSFCIEF